MMWRALVASIALISLLPDPASGQQAADEGGRLVMRTRTLILAQDSVPGVYAEFPVYQWLEMTGYDLGTPGLSVHTSLWGFGGLGSDDRDLYTGDRLAGDIDLLYAQMLDPKGGYGVRVGRQMVAAGPGLAWLGHMDGAWARGAMGPVDLQVYGGHVVESRFMNLDQSDWVTGARLGYRRWGLANLGVSYVRAWNDAEVSRELVGADLAVGRIAGFDATAFASFDLVGGGLAESGAALRYEVFRGLTFGLHGRQAAPGRLMDQTSIFSAFSVGDWAEGGALVEYALTPQWVVGGQYAHVFFPGESSGLGEGEEAERFGVSLTGFPRQGLWVQAAYNRLPSADNGYHAVRAAARWQPMQDWAASVDLLGFFYDDPPLSAPEAGSESLTGRLFGEYALADGLRLGLGGELGRTVYSEVDARGILRLTWTNEMAMGGAR